MAYENTQYFRHMKPLHAILCVTLTIDFSFVACLKANLIKCVVPEKDHTHPMEGQGRGILKAKILKAKYEAKLEFLGGGGGWGVQNKKNLLWGEYGYFLQLHNVTLSACIRLTTCLPCGVLWTHKL